MSCLPESLSAWAFAQRALSTAALEDFRAWRDAGCDGYLALLSPRESTGVARAWSERLRRQGLLLNTAQNLAARGRVTVRTWMNEEVLAWGTGNVQVLTAILAALEEKTETSWQATWLSTAGDESPADLVDSLALDLRTPNRPSLRRAAVGARVQVPLISAYHQRFLVRLIARNRGESEASVLREGISLLLDPILRDDESRSS